jgi:hypothetical protein
MEYPKYLVNISYYPSRVSGQQLVNIGGVTQSMPTYSEGYYIASMPEIKIAATGSDYPTALNNLLLAATSSNSTGTEPYNSIRTW